MSEPLSAFLKLRMDRDRLVHWLDQPVVSASHWSDWRRIGGRYYFKDGVQDIASIAAAELAENIGHADHELSKHHTYRAALRSILDSAEAPYMKRAQYRAEAGELVLASLTYAENLIEYLAFYAIVRGSEAVARSGDSGIAVIHNYVWGSPGDHVAHSALRIGPAATSSFLDPAEIASANGIVEEIGREMVPPEAAEPPPPIDDLDQLH